jgi:hypothetical protein
VLVRLASVLDAVRRGRDSSEGDAALRETSRREETFEGLRARGAPSEPGQYPDANEAASVLLAAGGPVDVAYHSLKL